MRVRRKRVRGKRSKSTASPSKGIWRGILRIATFSVYLPPSYATTPNRRYPVVYFLHGYAAHAENYWNMLSVPAAADAAIGNGSSAEMIVVLPDVFTVYNGGMFSNSPRTGDWEAYVAEDLVSLYRRSLSDNRGSQRERARRTFDGRIWNDVDRHETSGGLLSALCDEFLLSDERSPTAASGTGVNEPPSGVMAKALSAQAAAWAPTFLPKNGELQPLIADKWVTNSPFVMVDQYVPADDDLYR